MDRRFFLTGSAALLCAPAQAHSFYDWECCAGNDCAPIPDAAVKASKTGYTVLLQPGDHPLVDKPMSGFFSYGNARDSQDQQYHACIVAGEIKCLYAPKGGV